MNYLKQFGIILAVSFVGEILNHLIPLPIPASIYGIILLFFALELRLIKLEWVRDAGKFLIASMPVMFIPAAVGLIDSWAILRPVLVAYVSIMVLTTVIVMAASGGATQAVIRLKEKRGGKKNG